MIQASRNEGSKSVEMLVVIVGSKLLLDTRVVVLIILAIVLDRSNPAV